MLHSPEVIEAGHERPRGRWQSFTHPSAAARLEYLLGCGKGGCGACTVLALCRQLLAAGFESNRSLAVYRATGSHSSCAA